MGLINGFDWHQVDDVLLDMDGTLGHGGLRRVWDRSAPRVDQP